MKFLLKLFGINILVFFIYIVLIESLTHDSREGFLFVFLYTFFVGIQVLVNLVLSIIAAIRKNLNLKYYLAGLLLTFVFVFVFVACLMSNRSLFSNILR